MLIVIFRSKIIIITTTVRIHDILCIPFFRYITESYNNAPNQNVDLHVTYGHGGSGWGL